MSRGSSTRAPDFLPRAGRANESMGRQYPDPYVLFGSGTHLTPDDRPSGVFERLFGDLSGDQTEINRLRSRRLSVLDLLRDDIASLNRRLGARERLKWKRISNPSDKSNSAWPRVRRRIPIRPIPAHRHQSKWNYPTVGNLRWSFSSVPSRAI